MSRCNMVNNAYLTNSCANTCAFLLRQHHQQREVLSNLTGQNEEKKIYTATMARSSLPSEAERRLQFGNALRVSLSWVGQEHEIDEVAQAKDRVLRIEGGRLRRSREGVLTDPFLR